MHKIVITTECVADLPKELIEREEIGLIYYDIRTDRGLFRDTDEIDAENVMEYMSGGEKKAQSIIPSAIDYEMFFRELLKTHEEIVHIGISGNTSEAVGNAAKAIERLGKDGKRVCLVDSCHLSSGLGLLVMEAARCRSQGMGSAEITDYIQKLIPKVSTSFITNDLEYLYYNGKVKKHTVKICNLLRFHPVLWMKDGKISLKKGYFGRYEKAAERYIASTLRQAKKIDDRMGFMTYAGCNHELRQWVKNEIGKYISFRELWEQQASATVSCNCGPLTFGIIFISKENL